MLIKKQESRMKNMKLALALSAVSAVLMASGGVNASNTVTASVGVTAYIAAGLSADVNPMEFGALVAPTGDVGSNSVTIECGGNVFYSTHGSPRAVGQTKEGLQNSGVIEPVVVQPGSITISGEPNYAISVSVSAGATPEGITFIPKIDDDCSTGEQPGNTSLGDDGKQTLTLFGSLSVADTFDPSAPVETSAVVTVNYR